MGRELDIVAPAVLVGVFGLVLASVVGPNIGMFSKRHGRSHVLFGFSYLCWITLGFVHLLFPQSLVAISFFPGALAYHVVLGLLGIGLTLSAAFEFQHKNVKNVASGTLDDHATVTYNEMIEHSFYQGVNLVQIAFFYIVYHTNISSTTKTIDSYLHMAGLLFLVTSPWLIRDFFPVNKFSDNYNKIDERSNSLIRILYRIKKYQYVFYKHFLLHGLNVCVVLYNIDLVNDEKFRLYWLLLNTSYVMEFFLQTLVKKNYMTQKQMLVMQHILMLASSVAAVNVLSKLNIFVAVTSLVMNFINRKHDVINTLVTFLIAVFLVYDA